LSVTRFDIQLLQNNKVFNNVYVSMFKYHYNN
jgi:hypothetical protein